MKWLKMAGNGWKMLEIIGNGLNSLNGYKAKNYWNNKIPLHMTGIDNMARMGWKWLTIAGN